MSGESGGTPPTPGDLAAASQLHDIVETALLDIPGGLDTSVSGGTVANARLGRFIEEGLHNLYDATGGGRSWEEWLCLALGVSSPTQLYSQGPLALAALLRSAAGLDAPDPRHLTPISAKDDAEDQQRAQRAREQFVPDPSTVKVEHPDAP